MILLLLLIVLALVLLALGGPLLVAFVLQSFGLGLVIGLGSVGALVAVFTVIIAINRFRDWRAGR